MRPRRYAARGVARGPPHVMDWRSGSTSSPAKRLHRLGRACHDDRFGLHPPWPRPNRWSVQSRIEGKTRAVAAHDQGRVVLNRHDCRGQDLGGRTIREDATVLQQHRATDLRDRDEVAIKELHDQADRESPARERLTREARALMELSGSAVARVLDQGFSGEGVPPALAPEVTTELARRYYRTFEIFTGTTVAEAIRASG